MSRMIEIPLINVGAEEFVARASRVASEHGASFEGDTHSGTFSGMGVKGDYRIEGTTLYLSINKKPAFIPWRLVDTKVKEFFGL